MVIFLKATEDHSRFFNIKKSEREYYRWKTLGKLLLRPKPCGAGTFIYFFFYLGFLSRTFTIHRTAGIGGGYFFNSSVPLPPASQTLRY